MFAKIKQYFRDRKYARKSAQRTEELKKFLAAREIVARELQRPDSMYRQAMLASLENLLMDKWIVPKPTMARKAALSIFDLLFA